MPDSSLPNIVLFLIDTLRADRLGAYGYIARPTSPHIDELAEQGIVFESACAPAPWTIPSIASIFTSRLPCEHNVLSMYDRLPESFDTLAERLARAGYTTHSMYGNEFLAPEWGMHQGFMHFRPKGRNDGPILSDHLGPLPRQPFFVYVHNMEPHDPHHYAPSGIPGFPEVSTDTRQNIKTLFRDYKAAGEYDSRRRLPLGSNDLTAEQDAHLAGLRELIDEWNVLYDASVRLADHYLGSTVAALERRGLWDDTLFILVADHGEEMNDHGGWLHDQSVYDELMRVPLIVKLPAGDLAGIRVDEPVSLIDLLPTILDLIGRSDLAAGATGHSLAPLLRGRLSPSGEEGSLVVTGVRHNTTRFYRPWAETRGDLNVVVRRGCWKGIWNADLDTVELYDTCRDPTESDDRAAATPDLANSVRTFAASWYRGPSCSGSAPDRIEHLDEEQLQRLRAMGYAD